MPRKLNYLPIALFAFIMAYVLAVSSYLLKYFPLRSAGAMVILIANFFFLGQYDFHNIVPNCIMAFSYLSYILQDGAILG